jgi:hypothetical protein
MCRRAKRLKKLNHMMQSSAAQMATNNWRRRTLGLLAVIVVAHIVCFAVLNTQIDRRYQNAEAVSQIADALAASQQATLRANFMQVRRSQEIHGTVHTLIRKEAAAIFHTHCVP